MFKRRQCSVCGHRARIAIDAELAEGIATREVAARYGLSKSAVARHVLLHVVDADDRSGDDAIKGLLDSAQRALRRAEAKGDHKSVLEALRLLSELRKRGRIQAAASAADEPQENNRRGPQKNPQDLVEQLKQIYGLKGAAWDRAIAEREKSPGLTERTNEELIEQLRGYVERCGDADPTSGALCTRLASRILRMPLDAATEVEVSKLEAAAEGDDGMENLVEEVGEADDECDEPSDGRDESDPDGKPDGIECDVNGDGFE